MYSPLITLERRWTYKLKKFTAEEISTHNRDAGVDLRPHDIIVSEFLTLITLRAWHRICVSVCGSHLSFIASD